MRGMDCRKIDQLIYPYMDGELTPEEAEIVRVHLSTCAGCGNKYQSWQQISAALHDLGEKPISAPPGFTAAVMQRIADGEKAAAQPQKNSWFSRKWKQTAAAVAAAVMLMAGTLFTGSGSLLQVADNTPTVIQPGNISANNIDAPANTDNDPAATDVTPNNSDPANITAGPNSTDVMPSQVQDPSGATTPPPASHSTVNEPGVTQPSDPEPLQPRVLLNKDRALTTTLLQVEAADSAAAVQQAVAIASRVNAPTQNLGQQVNGAGSYTVLKITVGKASAPGLLNELSSLGTVENKEVTKQNISSQYSSKLSQYQALFVEHATQTDAAQKEALEQRIKSLESELADWEQQAEQETIILWVASK